MNKNWNGYCTYCGGFGHRASSCPRWKGVRLARPEA